jgi:hypothetical protein
LAGSGGSSVSTPNATQSGGQIASPADAGAADEAASVGPPKASPRVDPNWMWSWWLFEPCEKCEMESMLLFVGPGVGLASLSVDSAVHVTTTVTNQVRSGVWFGG